MLPVIALVGRPNVGKSTLFNYLTGTRDALVADYPGLTRDRQYGFVKKGRFPCIVVDTGGIESDSQGIADEAGRQVNMAMEEADLILFMVDGRQGLNADDQQIATRLRQQSKPVLLVTNKVDGLDALMATADFHSLGMGNPLPIAASHGRGIDEVLAEVKNALPNADTTPDEEPENQGIAIAVVGRPNVGKSTLVNRVLGEERVVVYDQPGTTRDSIFIPFEKNGKRYTLIDTAGMRRRSKVTEAVEKFSIIKSLQAIEKAHVVIYLIDAREGITEQDAGLLGTVLEAGKALVLGLNKWDGLGEDQKTTISRQLDIKLPFLGFAEKYHISALHGTGVGNLFDMVEKLYQAAMTDMSTSLLSRILSEAMEAHQPPLVRGRRIKLKFAHQGGHNPPTIVIHGNQTKDIPEAYTRYLINTYRSRLQLEGTPIRIIYRATDNPFKDRKNVLTERQIKKRKRMMRHIKKNKR